MGNDLLTGFLAGQSDNGGNNGNNSGGFFGNEGLWAVIILAIIFGWGNGNGLGGNRGGTGNGGENSVTYVPYPAGFSGFSGFGAGQAALTRSDLCSEFNFNDLQGSVRGISQGICDSTFALNNTMVNGFNGVNNAICNLGFTTQQGFNANQLAMMQGQNAIQTQIAQCCCDNRAALADLKYDMATSDCSIKTLVNQLAQQIMWGQQNGLRDLTELSVTSSASWR